MRQLNGWEKNQIWEEKIKEDKEKVGRIYGRLDERDVKWEPYVLFSSRDSLPFSILASTLNAFSILAISNIH